MRVIQFIFDTGATYLYYSNKVDFLELEDREIPINLKFIDKGLGIYEFGFVENQYRIEILHIIAIQDQTYNITGLPKDLCIIPP